MVLSLQCGRWIDWKEWCEITSIYPKGFLQPNPDTAMLFSPFGCTYQLQHTSPCPTLSVSAHNELISQGHSLVPRLLWGVGEKEPGTHCLCMHALFCHIDHKIIQIIYMTTCWLYGYIISSILLSIYERSRERWLPWTHRFHRLSTWKDHNGETTSTTLELAELQLVLLRSVWSNRKESVS